MKWRTAVIVLAAAVMPIILVPATVSPSVADSASERELVEAFVRTAFLWTGRINPWSRSPTFEFADTRIPGVTYRLKKDDKVLVRFSDGSTVMFRFIGTINCPSGLCFEWVIGTERAGRQRRAEGEHSGRERGDRYAYAGSTGVPLAGRPYDPYDESTWAGVARSYQ